MAGRSRRRFLKTSFQSPLDFIWFYQDSAYDRRMYVFQGLRIVKRKDTAIDLHGSETGMAGS